MKWNSCTKKMVKPLPNVVNSIKAKIFSSIILKSLLFIHSLWLERGRMTPLSAVLLAPILLSLFAEEEEKEEEETS